MGTLLVRVKKCAVKTEGFLEVLLPKRGKVVNSYIFFYKFPHRSMQNTETAVTVGLIVQFQRCRYAWIQNHEMQFSVVHIAHRSNNLAAFGKNIE